MAGKITGRFFGFNLLGLIPVSVVLLFPPKNRLFYNDQLFIVHVSCRTCIGYHADVLHDVLHRFCHDPQERTGDSYMLICGWDSGTFGNINCFLGLALFFW